MAPLVNWFEEAHGILHTSVSLAIARFLTGKKEHKSLDDNSVYTRHSRCNVIQYHKIKRLY